MSQERLSELAILSIEKEMLEELKYKNLISNFASQKTTLFIIPYHFIKLRTSQLLF